MTGIDNPTPRLGLKKYIQMYLVSAKNVNSCQKNEEKNKAKRWIIQRSNAISPLHLNLNVLAVGRLSKEYNAKRAAYVTYGNCPITLPAGEYSHTWKCASYGPQHQRDPRVKSRKALNAPRTLRQKSRCSLGPRNQLEWSPSRPLA